MEGTMKLSRHTIRLLVLYVVVISQVLFAQQAKQKTYARSQNNAPVPFSNAFRQGFSLKIWMGQNLMLGSQAWDGNVPADPCGTTGLGAVYPPNSCDELLYGAGPVIGGIIDGVPRVSESYNVNTGGGDFTPWVNNPRNKIWITSATDTTVVVSGYYKKHMSKRSVDDDGDGKIDEDELDGEDNDSDWVQLTDDLGSDGLDDQTEKGCKGAYDPVSNPDPAYDNWEPTKRDSCRPDPVTNALPLKRSRDHYTQGNGIPDHGEPHVDEDYAAVSDQDVYLSATDTSSFFPNSHQPMNIKIHQKSYAWKSDEYDGILPIEYEFVNIGNKTIHEVYLGFVVDADIGSQSGYASNNTVGYFNSYRTAYIANPSEPSSTPLGLTFLSTSKTFDSLKLVFRWFSFDTPCGVTADDNLYECLSCPGTPISNCLQPSPPQTLPFDAQFIFSVGPYNEMKPGDTLRMTISFISGYTISVGSQSLKTHAEQAIKLWGRGWNPPAVIPSPCLEISQVEEGIKLDWSSTKSGCVNPMEVWDDSNNLIDKYPMDHWRRNNPPPGHTRGGRIFEGFRLYRSEDPNGSPESFHFMKQYDVVDGLHFDFGIETTFIDSFARKGNTYWYAVTSFGIPDMTIITRPLATGGFLYDTLYSESYESPLEENKTKYYYSFASSEKLGEVLVVPNPYRGSEYYVNGDGFEGLERDWTPYKRMVRFIHLPAQAHIRIYTIAGEIVATFRHDEAAGDISGQHDFHLFTESGRQLANGIYVYTVESEYGKQIGKFVIAR
jgi:hypothetical protein